jgi:hypothetical protein
MTRRYVSSAASAPHSWDLEHWPQAVYPHSESRARWLIRAHRDELLAAGALVRVGRELVVIGDRYARWLQAQAANVPGFESNANRRREAGAA